MMGDLAEALLESGPVAEAAATALLGSTARPH
jgi:hypothetical protein